MMIFMALILWSILATIANKHGVQPEVCMWWLAIMLAGAMAHNSD